MRSLALASAAGAWLVLLASAAHDDRNVTASASEGAAGGEKESATSRLFNTLLVTFGAVLLGFASVRLQLVMPDSGDLKGMGFFVGNIAFPLLIFKTVATAKLGDVDMGTLAACTLGKCVVLTLTWVITFFLYEGKRPIGQRFLTATIFGFYVIASNDFAVGFPVVKALYGGSADMGIYIAGNSLVGSMLFVPLIMIFFAIGGSLQEQDQGSESGADVGRCRQAMLVVRDILLNPVITMTMLGLLYKAAFGFTLQDDGMNLKLPSPLFEFVDLVASPFGMCALFLTGTSLSSPQVSKWPVMLVLMKVVICAFATYQFACLFTGDSEPQMGRVLHNFSFLYGMIPTSSAPLLFANTFDPSASPLIATGILLGLVIAGPMMFVAALFLESANIDMSAVLGNVLFTSNIASLVCGIVFLLILTALGREWGFDSPCKFLVAACGTTMLAYESLFVVMNPNIDQASCVAYNTRAWSPLPLSICWLQNSLQFMVLVLQWMLPSGHTDGTSWGRHSVNQGAIMVAACLVLGIVPGMLTIPNTVTEMCSVVEPPARDMELLPTATWAFVLLLTTLGLVGMFYARQRRKSHSEVPTDSEDSGTDSQAEMEPMEPGIYAAEATGWACSQPRGVMEGLVGLQALLFFQRVVNTSQVLAKRSVMGSFAEMLVVEGLLQHVQLPLLLLLLLLDRDFAKRFSGAMPRLLPWLCARSSYGVVEPQNSWKD